MALSLNNTVVARIAAALYGQQLGAASMTEALSEVSNLGSVEAWANQVFSRDFGTPSLALAKTILANVGVADDVKSTLATWLLGQMNTPKPGTTLVSLLNSFAATPSTGTYATQAAAFNASVSNAVVYASTYGTTDVTLAQAAITGVDAILTTGPDILVGNNFTGSLGSGATLQGFDSLTSNTGSNNTLFINGSTSGGDMLPGGLTLNNVQNVTLSTSTNAGGSNGTFDASGLTGVTAVNVYSQGTAGDTVKGSATESILVNSTGSSNLVTTQGGLNINVTSVAGAKVGGSASSNPAGSVTVSDKGTANNVVIDGGTSVTVTETKTNAITIGSATNPSGAITVTDSGGTGVITAYGGTNVTINSSTTPSSSILASSIVVGGVSGLQPSGAVSVTQTAVTNTSGAGYIDVDGGTSVTVNTTGGGSDANSLAVAVGLNSVPSGAVSITDTFSGANADVLKAYGTGSISINTSATSGAITVGSATPSKDPIAGSTVSVSNLTTQGTANYYGSSTTTVYTNGAASVSITGGGAANVYDEAATNALTTATLSGVGGNVALNSTALTTVNINNSTSTAGAGATYGATVVTTPTITTTSMALNLSGDTNASTSFEDDKATTLTVTGTASGTTYDNIKIKDTSTALTALNFSGSGNVSLQALTLASAGTSNVAITTSGSGKFNLGDLASYTNSPSSTAVNVSSITATGTGDITAQIDPYYTTFAGGTSGNDTVTLDYSGATAVAGSIVGSSSGANTLVITDTAAHLGVFASGATISPANFQTVKFSKNSVTSGNTATAAAAGSYLLPAGVTALQVASSGLASALTVTNVASGTSLSLLGAPGGTVTLTPVTAAASSLTNAMTINLGVASGSSATAAVNYSTTTIADQATVTVNALSKASSAGTAQNVDTYTITDATTTTYANSIGTLKITGAANAAITLQSTNAVNGLTTVDASANTGKGVTVTIADLKTAAATGVNYIGGAANLTATGSGAGITSGTGGVTYTLYASSDTVNLSAETAKSTIATGIGNYNATVTGFHVTSSSTTSDVIRLNANRTAVISTTSASTSATVADTTNLYVGEPISGTGIAASTTIAAITSGTGITLSQNATATATTNTATFGNYAEGFAVVTTNTNGTTHSGGAYTASNGVITFGTGESTNVNQQIADVQYLLKTTLGQGLAAFQNGSNTYVIETDGYDSNVITLQGVTGVTGVGSNAAPNTLVIAAPSGSSINYGQAIGNAASGSTAADITATQTTATYIDTGYNTQNIGGTTGGGTITVNGLATWGQITDSSGINAYSLTVNESNAGSYLVLNKITAANTITTLTVVGATTLAFNPTAALTVTSLVDTGTTLTTISVPSTATAALTIAAITDTALTKISDSGSGAFTLGSGTAIPNNGLSVTGGTAANTISVSGNTDVIKVGSWLKSTDGSAQTAESGAAAITTSGSNNTITIANEVTTTETITVTADNGTSGETATLVLPVNGSNKSYTWTTVTDATHSTTTTATELTSNINTAFGKYGVNATSSGAVITLTGKSVDIGTFAFTDGNTSAAVSSVSVASDVYNTVLASGTGSTISVDSGNNIIGSTASASAPTAALGNGAIVNLLDGNGVSANDQVWIGKNSIINLSGNTSANANDANFGYTANAVAKIIITGDAVGTTSTGVVAGTTSAAGTGLTTITGAAILGANTTGQTGSNSTNANEGHLTITFNNAANAEGLANVGGATIVGSSVASAQVNVATATSLANALDTAAKLASASAVNSTGQGAIDWFQYGGNTYIVEAVNSGTTAHTSLASTDYVVELTGLVVPASFASHTLTIA